MAKEGLHFTISAKDLSSKVLRGVLGTIGGFSKQATHLLTAPFRAMTSVRWAGLQANVQMLGGLARQMDALVDRGTRLSAVNKSFEALTGRVGPAARRLAREIQNASHRMLSFARSQEIANRALAGGLNPAQIKKTLDYVSRFAVATGKDVAQSLETVMTGLIRGSPQILDDVGLLADGIDGVRRNFDKIRGAGVFDQLGPAAQKAAIWDAAFADMARQAERLGVSGQEAVFQWATIKSSITDATDRLIAAATSSEALRNVLGDVSKVVSGIAASLGGPDQGKAFGALWDRLKEGAAAILGDIGELLVRPLMEGLSKVAAYFGDLLENAADRLIAKLIIGAKQIPMLAGMIPDAAAKAARGVLAAGRPQAPGFGGGGAPFRRTQAWWGGTVRQFAGMGRDPIERQNAAMQEKLTQVERRRLETELRREGRSLEVLKGLSQKEQSWKYIGAARKQVAEEIEADPALARMTRAQQEERARTYSRERVEAEILQGGRRIREIEDRLKPARQQADKQAEAQAGREARAALAASVAADKATPYYLRDVPVLYPGEVPPLLARPEALQAAAARVAPVAAGWAPPPPPPAALGKLPTTRPAGPIPGEGWRPAPWGARDGIPYDPEGGGRPRRGLMAGYRGDYRNISRQFGPNMARAWHRTTQGGILSALAAPLMMAAPTAGILGTLARFAGIAQAGQTAGDAAGVGVAALTRSDRPHRLIGAADWGAVGGDVGMRMGAGLGARIGGHIGWAPMLGLGAVGGMLGLLGGMAWNARGGGQGGGGPQTARDLTDGSQELAQAARVFRAAARELTHTARESDQAARQLAPVVALL